MIRKLRQRDIDSVLRIWLDANIEAHDFVPSEYWKENFTFVKEMLPQAEVYVYIDENAGEIQGFIGLAEHYIEGIFVRKEARSNGIGKALLDFAKSKKSELTLNVYEKNERAVGFYRREGFLIQKEAEDEATGEKEYFMRWRKDEKIDRCPWCMNSDKMMRYHDEEWGVPIRDDRKQFEFLMLEVMQCGLNWNMMIQKREIFRSCFDDFDYDKVAGYGEEDIQRIMETEGMIRSRRKIEAVIHNARCFQEIREEFGSFSDYIWSFTKGKTYLYTGHQRGDIPARNGLSDCVSKDLKKRGLKFMGAVTVYSHLQACGIINDHLESCFRYRELLDITDPVHKRRDRE